MSLSRSARAWLFDATIAVVFTTFCLVVTRAVAEDQAERFDGWTIATGVVIGAALVLRRVAPEVVLAVTVVGLGVYTVADFAGGPIYLAPLVPLYTIATAGERRRTISAVVAMAVAFVVISLLSDERAEHIIYL